MSEIFAKLRPCCVEIAKWPSPDNLEVLRQQLRLLKDPAVEFPHPLLEYVAFPLMQCLETPNKISESVLLLLFDCLSLLFSKCPIAKPPLLQDILSSVYSLHEASNGKGYSEEVKLSSISCIVDLLKSCSVNARQCLYWTKYIPDLGFAISVTLKFIDKEKLKDLNLKGIACLSALCWLEEAPAVINDEFLHRIGILSSFLPGITTTLAKVILSDNLRQGQAITSMALKTLSLLVSTLFSNDLMAQKAVKSDGSHTTGSQQGDSLLVKRDSNWWKNSATKLHVVIQKICSLRLWSQWKIRLSLCQFSFRLLTNCHRSLELSVPCLAESLMAHLCDKYDQVADYAKSALDSSSAIFDGERFSLMSLLEETIFSLLTSLPTRIKSSDASKRLGTLNLLLGYIQLMQNRVSVFLNSSHHLSRLSQAILQVLDLEVTSRKIWELEVSVAVKSKSQPEEIGRSNELYTLLHFKHFSDLDTLNVLVRICRLLGLHGDLFILLDHFLEIFSKAKAFQLQSIIVMNELLRGKTLAGSHQGSGTLMDHAQNVLSTYLSTEYWNRTASSLNHAQTDSRNTLFSCLLIDGVAACTEAMGKEFDDCLYLALSPVVEKMGSSKDIIRQTAYRTVCVLTAHCGYSSVHDLMASNASYLIDTAFHGLRHVTANSTAPRVLRVLLQYSDSTILPLLDDSLDQIFLALESQFGCRIGLLLPVLSSVVEALRLWFPPEVTSGENPAGGQSLTDFYAELEASQALLDEEIEGGNESSKTADANSAEDKEKDHLSEHQSLALRILKACVNYIGISDELSISLEVLSVVEGALYILASAEDEILPLIHTLLSPLLSILRRGDDLLSTKALAVIQAVLNVSGDFFSRRLQDGVWPVIQHALKQTDKNVLPGRRKINLELSALSTLELMTKKLTMNEKDLLLVVNAMIEYLQHSRLKEVQQEAFGVLKALTVADSDLAWLLLSEKQVLQPKFSSFPSIHLQGRNIENKRLEDIFRQLIE